MMSHQTVAQGMIQSTPVPEQSIPGIGRASQDRQSISGTRTPQPPCVLMPACHAPMDMLACCPQPQCSQLVSPEPTSQRCLELLAGAALDPSSGLSSTAPRAARGSAGPSGSGWQLAGTEPAGRDREAMARTCCPVPPLLKGTAQIPWGQGHGDPWWYLSGAGARAAAAPGPGAQPAHPPAGSAAVPGPAPRRSDPASAAPPWLGSPPPARPWAPCHQGHRGTPRVSPPLQVPPCLGEVHLLHLGQGGRLEQDAWPRAHRHGAGWAPGQLEAGAGAQAAGAGVRDAGQGAVSCGGTGSAPWGWAHRRHGTAGRGHRYLSAPRAGASAPA